MTLTFRYFDISYERQWVKVRDGERESDELLFYSHVHMQQQPQNVTSSSNVLRVELMTQMVVTSPAAELTTFPQNASLPIHVHGFIASFSAAGRSRFVVCINCIPILFFVNAYEVMYLYSQRLSELVAVPTERLPSKAMHFTVLLFILLGCLKKLFYLMYFE